MLARSTGIAVANLARTAAVPTVRIFLIRLGRRRVIQRFSDHIRPGL